MAFIQNKNSFLRVGNNYYPDIDGLRAIAIIGVVLYHFFPSLLRGGFFGVDIFFAISGFLITKFIFDSTKAEPFKILDFFARRIKRIFPSLLLAEYFPKIISYHCGAPLKEQMAFTCNYFAFT